MAGMLSMWWRCNRSLDVELMGPSDPKMVVVALVLCRFFFVDLCGLWCVVVVLVDLNFASKSNGKSVTLTWTPKKEQYISILTRQTMCNAAPMQDMV